jgi:hypothetical protein
LEKGDRPDVRNELNDQGRRCVKCGGPRTRIIGQSVSPPVYYVTCADCGHSSALATSPETPPASGDLNVQRVERLVRTVIADFDLPADVVAVAAAAQGWQVIVRTRTNRIVRVPVTVPEPLAIRAAITRALANA